MTVERYPRLAERARGTLAAVGIDNVEVRIGDGAAGAPDQAPFDGIVVTAMAPRSGFVTPRPSTSNLQVRA